MGFDIKNDARASIDSVINKVAYCLNGEWNDSIHESFYGVLDIFRSAAKTVDDTISKLNSISAVVDTIDIGRLEMQLDDIISITENEE